MTVDGTTRLLEPPFLVLATQNPIEYEGTYPLPEAQLDRFVLRTGFGYPSADDEWEMLERRLERRVDEVELREVVDRETLLEMQRAVEDVHVDESVGRYIVDLVAATRESPSVSVGSSPRGSLALLKLSRCRAALAGRDFVTPDDVKSAAVPALAHRLVLRPELWVQRRTGEDVVREVLDQVPDAEHRARVTRSADARLGAYAALAAAAFVAALALRRPELAVLAAPFALLVALGRPHAGPRAPGVGRHRSRARARGRRARRDRDRAGRRRGRSPRGRPGAPGRAGARRGQQSRCDPPRRRRGARAAGPPALRALDVRRGRRGLASRTRPGRSRPLRGPRRPAAARSGSTPRPERLRRLIAPAKTQATTGSVVRRFAPRGSSSPIRGRSCPATACAR